jgi:predicted dehydrogenase
LDEARLLLDKAHAGKNSLKLSVGHIERFNPAVQAVLKQKVAPAFIEAHRLAAFDPRGTDVAVVRDLMIHDIDLVLTFINSNIIDIQASAVAVVSEQADIANARLTFANGAVANLTASRISLHQMRKLRIFQQSGYYSLDLAKKQADMYQLADPDDKTKEGFRVPLGKSGQNLLYTKVTDTGEDMLKQELTAFLEAVLNDRPVAVSLDQATEALRVALEVERIGRESLERMLTSTTQA